MTLHLAGWIPCAICTDPIHPHEYRSARCWTDPTAITVAAHAACLVRIGEHELSLPPDPGENSVTHGATP
jgi:hypothetical protein